MAESRGAALSGDGPPDVGAQQLVEVGAERRVAIAASNAASSSSSAGMSVSGT
jgi:hypothetical protein